MSDDDLRAGSLSPRKVDTLRWRVVAELPRPLYAVGEVFAAWPQGEVYANVSRHGLGTVRNAEIAEWEAAGLIRRET